MTQPPLTKSHNLLCILTKTCFLNPLAFGLIALVRAALSVLQVSSNFILFVRFLSDCLGIVGLSWFGTHHPGSCRQRCIS